MGMKEDVKKATDKVAKTLDPSAVIDEDTVKEAEKGLKKVLGKIIFSS